MVMSDISPEVELLPVRACEMHPAIIIGTVRSLWTCMAMGRYHIPQNAFLVLIINTAEHTVRSNQPCTTLSHIQSYLKSLHVVSWGGGGIWAVGSQESH